MRRLVARMLSASHSHHAETGRTRSGSRTSFGCSIIGLLGATLTYLVAPAVAQLPQGGVERQDRTEERAAELSLPDPYLDPSWPDENAEEMGSRYEEGRSDSVEDRPFDEEVEMQEEMRALEEVLGAAPAPVVVPDAPPTLDADDASPSAVPAPVLPTHEVLDAPAPDDNDDGFEKDPVEW